MVALVSVWRRGVIDSQLAKAGGGGENGGGIRRQQLAGGSEKAWRNGSVKKNISQWRKLISMKRNNQRK
jgi:hypothetical protein